MKFSEFLSVSFINEKNEDKVLQVLKKNMQPALDAVEKKFNEKAVNWNIPGKCEIVSKEKKIEGGYEVIYNLTMPKGFNVDGGRDFSTELDRNLRDIERKVEKTFMLPFFKGRWVVSFHTLSVSGRGPSWDIARISVREKEVRGEMSAEDRGIMKDDNAFSALKSMLDEIRLYHDGEDLIKYANKAGRISPEIVKEAKKLAKAITDFKKRAEAEMKKLASQHSDDYIKRHYS